MAQSRKQPATIRSSPNADGSQQKTLCQAETPPLCTCGCGKPVERKSRSKTEWNRILKGHHNRLPENAAKLRGKRVERYVNEQPIGEQPPLCRCGCGQPVKWSERLKRWSARLFGHAVSTKVTAYHKRMQSLRKVVDNPQPPPCRCGCGGPVRVHPHGAGNYWGDYIDGHAMVGRRGIHSAKSLADRAEYMRTNNPMKRPEIAEKARRSMCLAVSPSKTEMRFLEWVQSLSLPVEFVGDGKLWVNRKNPDFRVPNQGKVIELSQDGIFNGKAVEDRTAAGYGLDKVRHYRKAKWQCMVIFVKHRQALTDELAGAIRRFAALGTLISGVWNFDHLLLFDESSSALQFASTISTVRPPKHTLLTR